MLLTIHNGWFYIFCHKHQGCELNYSSRELSPLCRIPTYLSGYQEELGRNQFNLFKLNPNKAELFEGSFS